MMMLLPPCPAGEPLRANRPGCPRFARQPGEHPAGGVHLGLGRFRPGRPFRLESASAGGPRPGRSGCSANSPWTAVAGPTAAGGVVPSGKPDTCRCRGAARRDRPASARSWSPTAAHHRPSRYISWRCLTASLSRIPPLSASTATTARSSHPPETPKTSPPRLSPFSEHAYRATRLASEDNPSRQLCMKCTPVPATGHLALLTRAPKPRSATGVADLANRTPRGADRPGR
jgi:hypothetical protein